MSKLSKLLSALGLIAGVVLLAVALSRRPGKASESDIQASAAEAARADSAETNHSAVFIKRTRRHPAAGAANSQPMGAADAATNLMTGWEDKMDDILGSSNSDLEKAKQMLEMFPQLPADGQEELARHLSNLLPDQEYGLMHAWLTNASLPEAVLDVLLDDVLNRPNSLKLPALLDIARTPQHPNATEAKDFLELFLDEDNGDDWGKWQASMEQWLRANPD
jgi:hypothetical protein